MFAKIKFKKKICISCGISFAPSSGVQKTCNNCRHKCPVCGGPKSEHAPQCSKCACKFKRKFKRVCEHCGGKFTDSNNKSKLCKKCFKLKSKGICIDCGCKIKVRATRCNSCNAYNRKPADQPGGWNKYEYNDCLYRSKWEIEFAKILTECQVDFEYEVYHAETKTRPDFFIPALKRFVEIHPDYHGIKKSLPDDCVLVKTLSHSRAEALAIAFKVNKTAASEYINNMSKAALMGMFKISKSLTKYFKHSIINQGYNS
jgi:hypothetical protein